MERITPLYHLLLVAIAFLVTGCSNNEKECIGNEAAYVTSVEAPSEVELGETIQMALNFQVINGCGKFGKFIESDSGMTKTIEVEARYEGCFCPENMPVFEVLYEFTPTSRGEYLFRFRSGREEFITITVLVV